MAMPPRSPLRITFSIHGDHSDGPRYTEFIENLRNEVSDPNRQKHGFRVLYDEKTQLSMPNDFLDICLEAEEKSISVLMRRDNLYIVGFKSNNELNNVPNYIELRDEIGNYRKLIPNSKASKIRDDYHAFDEPLHELSLGKYSLSRVVDVLYKSTAQSCGKEVKLSIMTLIVVISEAMRLERVFKFVSNQIVSDDPKTLGSEELDDLILNWATKSRLVLDKLYPPDAKAISELKEDLTLVKAFAGKGEGRYHFTPPKNKRGKRK